MTQCTNFLTEPGLGRAFQCTREAGDHVDLYTNGPLCNICGGAQKRGAARRKANEEKQRERRAIRDTAAADRQRKLNAYPKLVRRCNMLLALVRLERDRVVKPGGRCEACGGARDDHRRGDCRGEALDKTVREIDAEIEEMDE
ncbi:hypothetical protein LCGC14_1822750 [marine sediment metagenome]|uniref:Uncharacterized protein n=1 Tax=marine sediment metagenome TaxID=412755 RepID=A0A0F9H6K2_9ZZZZ